MRPTITTTFTPRVKPTTNYMRPREGFCYTWDTIPGTWDEANFSWDESCFYQIETIMTSTRKLTILETESGLNFELENGDLLLAEGGLVNNKIKTIYT